MRNKKKETEIIRSVYSKKKPNNDMFFMSSTRNRCNDYPNLQVLCDELSACNVDDHDDVQDVVKGYKE